MKKTIAIQEAGLTISTEFNAYMLTCKFYQRALVCEWEETENTFALNMLRSTWATGSLLAVQEVLS